MRDTINELEEEAQKAVVALSRSHEARTMAKATHRQDVRALLKKKVEEIDDETEMENMFQDIDDEPPTATENDRDEARRLAELLQMQLDSLKWASEAADIAADSEEEAIKKVDEEALKDLRLHFPASIPDLPSMEGEPSTMQKSLLAVIWHFCRAAPFGQLPAVTFQQLGIPPSFAHTLVGDTVWEGYWGERHTQIADTNWVPTTMLSILKYISDIKAEEHAQHKIAETPSVARFNAAAAAAAKRRARGSPY